MKALSVKQPWASLIVEPDLNNIGFGIKPIENRTWPCPKQYIGQRVLIHAGLSIDKNAVGKISLINGEFAREIWYKINDNKLPLGAIIGSVQIVDCVVNHHSIWAEKGGLIMKPNKEDYYIGGNFVEYNMIDYKRDLNEWERNKPIYNWVLAHPIEFPEPILAKGKLGFWNFPDIIAEPEEKDGELFCHCQLPVKLENQVSVFTGERRCRYCGAKWYR